MNYHLCKFCNKTLINLLTIDLGSGELRSFECNYCESRIPRVWLRNYLDKKQSKYTIWVNLKDEIECEFFIFPDNMQIIIYPLSNTTTIGHYVFNGPMEVE